MCQDLELVCTANNPVKVEECMCKQEPAREVCGHAPMTIDVCRITVYICTSVCRGRLIVCEVGVVLSEIS